MTAEFPGLERGQAAAVTKRRHIPTWLYKQSHRLTEEMTRIRKDIENIGTFNANKQREKALRRLENQSLPDELQEYRDFIDSIPQEILEELKTRYEMSE